MITFEQDISAGVQRHLTNAGTANASSIRPLLHALGCVDVEHMSGIPTSPAATDPLHEDLVTETLRLALRKMFDGSGWTYESISIQLLDGLSKNNRWRLCLETIDDAYALASLLFVFSIELSVPRTASGERVLEQVIKPAACAMLTGWFQPEVPMTDVPVARDLAQMLFGEAWCYLVVENSFNSPSNIKHLMQAHRPPFLPRLLKGPAETVQPDLPSLE